MASNDPTTTTSTNTATSGTPPFYMVVLGAVVVGAGIYWVTQVNSRAGWGLALLTVLIIAFAYPQFGNQLILLMGGNPPTGPNTGVSQQTSTPGGLVGPVGPVGGQT